MKAICVNSMRALEVRDIPTPEDPPPGHVLIDIEAAAINHGDKTFLAGPLAGGNVVPTGGYDVWGASATGVVVAVGADSPKALLGKNVAIYKSLSWSPQTIGLWCQRVQIPHSCCVVLPAEVRPRDYCGSLVNIMTAYAFLSQLRAAGHQSIIVTAGRSATARALASIARRWDMQTMFVVRSAAGGHRFVEYGAGHVFALDDENFESEFAAAAAKLGATAVFDGVGGGIISRIVPILPMNTTIFIYGFLGGMTPVSFPTSQIMAKNLTIQRFRVYESETVKDPHQLSAALAEIAEMIGDMLFKTNIGREFSFDEIAQAMEFLDEHGGKAVIVNSLVSKIDNFATR